MNRVRILLACLFPLVQARAGEPVNLVANGDFSKVVDGKPDDWSAVGNEKEVVQTLRAARDANIGPYAEVTCTRCDSRSPSGHAMLAQVGAVRLERGKTYELTCRMRAEGLRGRQVKVAVSDTKDWSNAGLYAEFPLGGRWSTCRRFFTATRDVGPTGRLQFWFNEPGTLCVADVRIVECRLGEAEPTDQVAPAGGRNLLPNGSFEVGAAGWSSLGAGAGWGNLTRLHGTIESTGGSHGESFLRIPLGGERTPVLHFDYYEPVVRRELSPLAASLGWVKVDPNSSYTLSCDMRASAEGVRAALGARSMDPAGSRRDHRTTVKLTTSWQRCSFTFRPERRFVFVFAGPVLEKEEQVHVDLDAVQLEKGDRASDFQPRREVEFALAPTAEGGIFEQGRGGGLVLRAFNHGGSGVTATVRFRATDFEDRQVALPIVVLNVPAGTAARHDLPLPDDWRGYYRVRAEAEAGAKPEGLDLRLAAVPGPAPKDSVCGINHAFATAHLIGLAAKGGVAWYRDWSLKWQHIEPSREQFHWEVGDRQIDRVLREEAKLVALLPPFPSADWSSEAPDGLPTKGYPGVRLRQAWGPKDPNDLAGFVERAVLRYKDRVGTWEFLNEPIYTDYSLPGGTKYGGKRYAPADYVALLAVAARAMRKADPNCKVIAGVGGGPKQMAREIIEAGVLNHADILNLHIYPGCRRPEAYLPEMDEFLSLMDARGGRKPIWITEFSYYATDDPPRRPFAPAPGSWSEERLLDGERQCADLTLRFFLVMLSRNVQKVFIHSGASGSVNSPSLECALFAQGGSPRKLLPALAVMTRLLGPSPAFAGERRLRQTGHCLAFETGKQSILALWCEDDEPGLEVTLPAGAAAMDVMGRTIGGPHLKLSTSPTYVLGPSGKAKELLSSVSEKQVIPTKPAD